MAVTRCVCFRMTFREVLTQARAHGWTSVEEVGDNLGCGTGCGGCRPYLVQVLATGNTTYRVRTDDRPPQPCTPEPWDIR